MSITVKSLLNNPDEVIDRTLQVQEKRAQKGIRKMIILGILAGIFIAGGASASNVVIHTISNFGVSKIVAGCVFPVGLMMIIFIGGELFTGNCLMILGVVDKKVKIRQMLRVLIVVFLSNMIGAMLVVLLIYGMGQYNYSEGPLGPFTMKIAYNKVSMSFSEAFCSGVMCNIFVCGAVFMAGAAVDESGKIWAMFFAIMAFVVSGFEHCIANMYYIPSGILAKQNDACVNLALSEYGLGAEQLSNINWGTFFTKNLIPVTLGNIVGGMALGVALYLVYKKLPNIRKEKELKKGC